MAERKASTVIYRHQLTPEREIFRIIPKDGGTFPSYTAGQYIALSRDNCRLTKKIIDTSGQSRYLFDVDEAGNQKRGTVTHHFTIASAPYETLQQGYLEFYIVKQSLETTIPGTFTDSLFHVDVEHNNTLFYSDEVYGDFTLEQRASGFEHIVMVATGTGVAPFVSMLKQVHHQSSVGNIPKQKFTLFYTNRTLQELGYHEEFAAMEQQQNFNFVYVPLISRPATHEKRNTMVGQGRANDVLRLILGTPSDIDRHRQAKTLPVLPPQHTFAELRERIMRENTVILTCGNAEMMTEVEKIASAAKIRCEMELW